MSDMRTPEENWKARQEGEGLDAEMDAIKSGLAGDGFLNPGQPEGPKAMMAPDEQREAAIVGVGGVLADAMEGEIRHRLVHADERQAIMRDPNKREELRRLDADISQTAGILAAAVVERLEEAGWLALPEVRSYNVLIDDPDMTQPWHYDGVQAVTARGAAMEAARRAIREDPTHGMPGSAMAQATQEMVDAAYDSITAENYSLIDAVAMYAIVQLDGDDKFVGENEVGQRYAKAMQKRAEQVAAEGAAVPEPPVSEPTA
jgi:hypothetical protein